MITSAKIHTKKKRTHRTLGQIKKQRYTDKITQRSIHIHTKKDKEKYIYIFLEV